MPLPYSHEALGNPSNEIRLLHVLPGARDEPIACILQAAHRKAAPEYGAISYTWGNPDNVRSIVVNGRTLVVRHNCYLTLWQVRYHEIDMPIWIDSICIDQNNNAEKSQQVLFMGSIYANATFTLACIGDGPHLRTVADDIVSIAEEDVDRLRKRWQNLLLLASNEYFGRLWIVQELYHSSRIAILCGEDILAWEDLEPYFLKIAEVSFKVADINTHLSRLERQDARYIDRFNDLEDLSATNLSRFIHFRKFRQAQLALKGGWTDEVTGQGLTGVLLSFGEGGCVDPRDKIYGLLSLAQDSRWLVDFPVSYTRPLTDVVKDVVSRIASESITENTSRLIASMLRWFNITPDSVAGQSLLASHNQMSLEDPWGRFARHVTTFESIRVWRVLNLPLSGNTRVPLPEDIRMRYNVNSEERQYQPPKFEWPQICYARGLIIKSVGEDCFIAGPNVKVDDFIVEFNAMRDDQDEYSTAVICRRPEKEDNRMDILDQATLIQLTNPRDFKSFDSKGAKDNRLRRTFPRSNIIDAELQEQYLTKRMLFVRPCKEQVVVHLRPFDLITSVMTRGDILNRVKFPIRTCDTGCYAERVEVDESEVRSRTFTITMQRPPQSVQQIVDPTSPREGLTTASTLPPPVPPPHFFPPQMPAQPTQMAQRIPSPMPVRIPAAPFDPSGNFAPPSRTGICRYCSILIGTTGTLCIRCFYFMGWY